jgi:hypothetical protein
MSDFDDQTDAREGALTYLRSLSEKSFTEFFYEAVRDRPKDDIFDKHFVLATVENVEGTESGVQDWVLSVVGLPADDRHWSNQAPIYQAGNCRRCKLDVMSWSKQIRCPICGAEAYGT